MDTMTTAVGTKRIELRNGIAHRVRMNVNSASDGLYVDGDGANAIQYRPTGLRTDDGLEIWTPQVWRTH